MADLDDITNITVAAYKLSPSWSWLFRYRQQYPNDHWHCLRDTFRQVLLSDLSEDKITINVITSPTNEDQSIIKPIAFSLWTRLNNESLPYNLNTSDLHSATTPLNCSDRRDIDPVRNDELRRVLTKSLKKHSGAKFGNRHIHLNMLATLPDYQRRGAGSALVRWGLKLAHKERLGISLFSSQTARSVYTNLGFELVEELVVQVEGEKESANETAMEYNREFLERESTGLEFQL